jgi:hypothetical protein
MNARNLISRGPIAGFGVWSLVVLSVGIAALLFMVQPAFAGKEYVPGGTFGEAGSGNGQFNEPNGIAVNDTAELTSPAGGDIYVVDSGNNRVERFNPTGTVFEGQFDGTGTFPNEKGAKAPQPLSAPQWIAIDNSGEVGDPAAEDVYVVDSGHKVLDRFSATGEYLGQLTGFCEAEAEAPPCSGSKLVAFGELFGVAVDSTGDLWVHESVEGPEGFSESRFHEFSDTGVFLRTLSNSRRARPSGLGFDSAGNLYTTGAPFPKVLKIEPATGNELEEFGELGEGATALAVAPSSNNVLVDLGSALVLYGPFGEPSEPPLQSFAGEGLSESHGLAASLAGNAFATQRTADSVARYDYVLLPTVTTDPATETTNTEATLNGEVNPEGEAIEDCRFEYGLAEAQPGHYEHTVACAQPPASITGTSPVAVSADVSGLRAGATYHFRLSASDANGTKAAADETFILFPTVADESSSGIASTEATVNVQINPGGLSSSYRVEYGTSIAYGSVTPEVSAGAGTEASSFQVHLTGLQPGTSYHARVVARNELGVTLGDDLTFATLAAGGPATSVLPDNRVYEDVSLSDGGDGEVFFPFTGHERLTHHQIGTGDPVRASANGNAVVYAAEPPPTGGSGSTGDGGGNVLMATRGANGWSPRDLMPPVTRRELYKGYSSDLSLAFLNVHEETLTSDAPPNCEVLYSQSTSDGAFHAAFTTTETPGKCGEPRFAGVSADHSSAVFESEARLTPEAIEGNMEGPETDTFNLYDSVGGHLYLVNVLPGGAPDVNAAVGGVTQGEEEFGGEFGGEASHSSPGYHHYGQAIAADGSRIVWTDLNTGDLYVRENPASPSARTVLVAAEAYFRGASSDGSKVLYTKGGDLYEYDVASEVTHDLAPGGSVLGVLGSSEDASIVYFVAEGVLAGNENANGEKAGAGQPNLYVRIGAEARFIATLSPEDNTMEGANTASKGPVDGDWRAGFNTRTAEVTPDGRSVVFTSRRSITGYDNQGGCRNPKLAPAGCPEVFTYDANANELICASCNPTGAPPTSATVARVADLKAIGGAFLPTPNTFEPSSTYQLRTISDDGSRVFFDTSEPLVPQDTDGVQDVYEWERAGSGTCREAKGCVYLLSGDLSHEEAVMVDASASGNDVFFTTRAQLAPQDENGLVDLYDARVDGGFPHVSTACTGTGCQGVPPAPPIFATPSSVTFRGTGNFPAAPVVKPVIKPLTRALKLAKALKACKKKPQKRRASCERQARRQYAPKSKSRSHKGGK